MKGRSTAPQNNRVAATTRDEVKAIDDARVAEAKLPLLLLALLSTLKKWWQNSWHIGL